MRPGAWKLAGPGERAAKSYGEHAYYASPHGELVLSYRVPAGVQRILLTWAMRDGKLVVDQPSAPREDIFDVLVASEHTLQIDGSWYVRDDTAPLDPDAQRWALVAGGAWYGIENAGPEPFTPFLMIERGAERQLVRIVDNTSAEAELAADRFVREARPFERAVWVRDGRLRSETGAIDAILVEWFAPDGERAGSYGLPYTLGPTGATIAGGLHIL